MLVRISGFEGDFCGNTGHRGPQRRKGPQRISVAPLTPWSSLSLWPSVAQSLPHILIFSAFFLFQISLSAQRGYKPSSVLASGTWYKLAVDQPGIYRIDIPFLTSLGINTSSLASNSIRLFGNGG